MKRYAVWRDGIVVIVMNDPDAERDCQRWIKAQPNANRARYSVREFKDTPAEPC